MAKNVIALSRNIHHRGGLIAEPTSEGPRGQSL
jgi:hypothetical protein